MLASVAATSLRNSTRRRSSFSDRHPYRKEGHGTSGPKRTFKRSKVRRTRRVAYHTPRKSALPYVMIQVLVFLFFMIVLMVVGLM
jgi:hypothetical protein